MEAHQTDIAGCFRLVPKIYTDHRGWFYESYSKRELYRVLGEELTFVQDNRSNSGKNVLRGLHFQEEPYAQAKLIQVVRGSVRDVIVDLRKDSPSFLRSCILELTAERPELVYLPKGLAHGFLSLEEGTIFQYKCSDFYKPEAESGIRFDDPDLNLDWGLPNDQIILSQKDKDLPALKTILG